MEFKDVLCYHLRLTKSKWWGGGGGGTGQDFWDKLTWNFVEEFHKRMKKIDENIFSTITAFI